MFFFIALPPKNYDMMSEKRSRGMPDRAEPAGICLDRDKTARIRAGSSTDPLPGGSLGYGIGSNRGSFQDASDHGCEWVRALRLCRAFHELHFMQGFLQKLF
jgi:hypothetical protein